MRASDSVGADDENKLRIREIESVARPPIYESNTRKLFRVFFLIMILYLPKRVHCVLRDVSLGFFMRNSVSWQFDDEFAGKPKEKEKKTTPGRTVFTVRICFSLFHATFRK